MPTLHQEKINFYNNPSIDGLMRCCAVDTWHRIKFCQSHPASHLHETTITQNIVYEFLQMEEAELLQVTVFESNDEKATGSDLEIILRSDSFFVRFVVQAKKIGRQLKYEQFHHTAGGVPQIDRLLKHAEKTNSIALYLFYNYSDDRVLNKAIADGWELPIDYFGCSFANARALYQAYYRSLKPPVPGFPDVHRAILAYPFEQMGYFTRLDFLDNYLKTFGDASPLGNYACQPTAQQSLQDSKNWHRLIRRGATIGRIGPDTHHKEFPVEFISQQHPVFLPSETGAGEPAFMPLYRIEIDLDSYG